MHLDEVILLSWIILLITLIGSPQGVSGRKGGKKGDSCSSDSDCDQDSFILCDKYSKTCNCPPSPFVQLFYSSQHEKCLSLVDGHCTYKKLEDGLPIVSCVDNAICLHNSDPSDLSGKCVCKKNYHRTRDGQCAENIPITNSNTIARNTAGVEIPGKSGTTGRSNLPSTRYPEPYHSFSSSCNFQFPFISGLISLLIIATILPYILINSFVLDVF